MLYHILDDEDRLLMSVGCASSSWLHGEDINCLHALHKVSQEAQSMVQQIELVQRNRHSSFRSQCNDSSRNVPAWDWRWQSLIYDECKLAVKWLAIKAQVPIWDFKSIRDYDLMLIASRRFGNRGLGGSRMLR